MEKQNTIIKKQGEFFGYPTCCVKAFLRRVSGKKTRDEQLQAARAGFIPCFKHANKILKGEISLDNIIENRICSVPFNNSKISIYFTEVEKAERFKEWLQDKI